MIKALVRAARPYWFRGKGRLLNRVFSWDGETEERIFGGRFNLDLSDYIQRNIFLGTYEPMETRIIQAHLQKGMTFLDVGANVGYFSALAASRVGDQGRVFAIEPSPYAFRKLQQMVEESGYDRVKVCPFALGSEAGRARMPVPPQGNHTPSLLSKAAGESVDVEIRTLDSCVAEWGIDRIDIMKIDIEGFEHRALLGATRSLKAGVIRSLLCEFNDYWLREAGTTPQALFDFIISSGFELATDAPRFGPGSLENCFFVRRH